MPSGLVFNLQRFSLHDGPGIRTTVFLKGCALSCSWCHNPESRAASPELMVLEDRCIRCGACVEACPSDLPVPAGGRAVEDVAQCDVCGACASVCPTSARQIAGREVEAEGLAREVLRDRVFFDQSGGGVTFSGGEPLHQTGFLKAALRASRDVGLHTVVDTCGLAPREELLEVACLTDLFLYDLKFSDNELHREHTGVGNEQILANLRTLADVGQAIWLRIPLRPDVNDGPENLGGIAALAASLPAIERICLLPYHRTGESKLTRLGRAPDVPKTHVPVSAEMEQAAAHFEAVGLSPQIGG